MIRKRDEEMTRRRIEETGQSSPRVADTGLGYKEQDDREEWEEEVIITDLWLEPSFGAGNQIIWRTIRI